MAMMHRRALLGVIGLGACLVLGTGYENDPSQFKNGAIGYLYNFGLRKYVGRKSDGSGFVIVDTPEQAIKLRSALLLATQQTSFAVIVSYNPLDLAQTRSRGVTSPSYNAVDPFKGYQGLKIGGARKDGGFEALLTKDDGALNTRVFLSPPIINQVGAFRIHGQTYCLEADPDTGEVYFDLSCTDSPKQKRNRQLFIWVGESAFRNGSTMDGTTSPEPSSDSSSSSSNAIAGLINKNPGTSTTASINYINPAISSGTCPKCIDYEGN